MSVPQHTMTQHRIKTVCKKVKFIFKSSGMPHWVIGLTVADDSNVRNAFIFRVKLSTLLGLPDPEDKEVQSFKMSAAIYPATQHNTAE